MLNRRKRTKAPQPAPPPFQVGDWVRFDLGPRRVPAVVVEDRGNLGVGGRRLYIVEVPTDPYEPMSFLMPADELEADPGFPERNRSIDKAKLIDYLKRSGSVSILMALGDRGRNQPHVWLCLDTLDNVTHTFSPDRGGIGGAIIPAGTLYENRKVFTAKKQQVAELLASFGLSLDEAEDVIRAVGTSPRSPPVRAPRL